MTSPLVICVPGPWRDRKELLTRVVSETKGDYMFLGMILAQPSKKRHVELSFCEPSSELENAFRIAGLGKLSEEVLSHVSGHSSIAFLKFGASAFPELRQDVIDFTGVLRQVGGIAVKVESSGSAHEWDTWFARIQSNNPFDWYRALVVLIGDSRLFYSCGMHLFGLADVEVSRELEASEAADLMNRFNYWRMVEEPSLASGETFSVSADAPRFVLRQQPDARHPVGELFHNPQGLWRFDLSEVRCPH